MQADAREVSPAVLQQYAPAGFDTVLSDMVRIHHSSSWYHTSGATEVVCMHIQFFIESCTWFIVIIRQTTLLMIM
jgi:hypothetical protein